MTEREAMMTDPNDTPDKPIHATDGQAPEPRADGAEDAAVGAERDAASASAEAHDEPGRV